MIAAHLQHSKESAALRGDAEADILSLTLLDDAPTRDEVARNRRGGPHPKDAPTAAGRRRLSLNSAEAACAFVETHGSQV